MAGAVTVMGVERELEGLKESLSRFRKHHEEVANALLNISGIGTMTGDVADKDDPRPAYVRQEWPKHVYHADGRDKTVADSAELQLEMDEGFRLEPYQKPQIAVHDPKSEKAALEARLKQQDATIAQLQDMVLKLGTPTSGKRAKKDE